MSSSSRGLRSSAPRVGSDSSPCSSRGEAITEPRINDRIRVPEVRLVGPEGEQVGIVSIGEALRLAQDSELDLVEVAPMARPPVVKLMDYGKFKYESAQKAREARRNQALTVIKEMRLRLKIDPHDYETKKGHVERFLKSGDKVKITVMFRGREQSRPEMGYRLLQRLAADVAELGVVESNPKQDGRNMVMVIAPHRNQAASRRRAPDREGGEGMASSRGAGAQRLIGGRRTTAPPRRPVPSAAPRCRARRHHTKRTEDMPKQKTHKGTAKRVRVTGTGKLVREHTNNQHKFEHKSSSRKRRLDGIGVLSPGRRPAHEASCSVSDRPPLTQKTGVLTWHA